MYTKTIAIAGMDVPLLKMVAGVILSCVVLKTMHEQYQAYTERSRDDLQVEIHMSNFDTIQQSMNKSAKVDDLGELIMKRHAGVLRVVRMTFVNKEAETILMKKDHKLGDYARDMLAESFKVNAEVTKVATLEVYFDSYNIQKTKKIPNLTIHPKRDDTVDTIYDQVETHVEDSVVLKVNGQVLPRRQRLVDVCDMSNHSVIVHVRASSANENVDDVDDVDDVTFDTSPSDIESYATNTLNMDKKKDFIKQRISYALNASLEGTDLNLEIVDKLNVAMYMDKSTYPYIQPYWVDLLNIQQNDQLTANNNKFLKHIHDLFLKTANKLKPLNFVDIEKKTWKDVIRKRIGIVTGTSVDETEKSYVYRQVKFPEKGITIKNKIRKQT